MRVFSISSMKGFCRNCQPTLSSNIAAGKPDISKTRVSGARLFRRQFAGPRNTPTAGCHRKMTFDAFSGMRCPAKMTYPSCKLPAGLRGALWNRSLSYLQVI